MSIRKGSRTIASSVPVTEWGSIDGTLADQADIKSALDSKAPTYSPTFTGTPLAPTAPIDTSNNQIATTKYVQDALLASESTLPEQTGNAGKFLSTNGTIPSWESVDILPSQSGQSGKFLTTNGTSTSWGTIDVSGKVDKVTTTSSKNRFYIITPAGAQSILEGEQTGQTAATVPIRTSSGTIRTATPTDNNDAATKQYVDDNAVKKTGAEEITGTKTFTNSIVSNAQTPLIIKISDYTAGTTPSSQADEVITFQDKNNWNVGYIQLMEKTDGTNTLYIRSRNKDSSNNTVTTGIDINAKTDGTVSVTAPTPSSVTDNTTKIATTEWVINVLKALYPVGSIYISTQNSCPLSAFFGTWQIVGTKILTDIPTQLSSKGNGMTLGLTNGSTNGGMVFNRNGYMSAYSNSYGTAVGTSGSSLINQTLASLGLTTDSTKSGIVTDTNATSLTVNLWQRTA